MRSIPEVGLSKKSFSRAERYAVWTVHGERCWLCRKPMTYNDMHIDHIIPETLEGTLKLAGVLKELGLPPTFNLNDWGNWMPAHGPCNIQKGEHVFDATPLIQKTLEDAKDKTTNAKTAHDKFLIDRKLDVAIAQVLQAHEDGSLNQQQMMELAGVVAEKHEPLRTPEMQGKPLKLASGLEVVSESDSRYMLRGPSGMTGYRPKGDFIHASWDCPNCGVTGWNGTRCIRCGMFIDPD